MFGLLSSDLFHIIGIPTFFVIIGIYANRLSRRDGEDTPMRNDWAVSTITLLMALGSVASDLRHATNDAQLSSFLGWFIGIFLMIFISIDHDRFRSWERDANGLLTNRKRIFIGVIWPNLISFIVFILYQLDKMGFL